MKNVILLSILACSLACNNSATDTTAKPPYSTADLWIGSYTNDSSPGIYQYRLKPDSLVSEKLSVINNIANPSFITFSPNGEFLFCVSEEQNGEVSSFKKNKVGEWSLINTVKSGGAHPCHLATDQLGRLLFVANYSSGNFSLITIAEDGSLELSQTIQHKGSGSNKTRQKQAHVHSCQVTPSNDFLLVADLGTDELVQYKINHETARLDKKTALRLKAGSGPRHITFHPSLPMAYVIQELSNTITLVAYNNEGLEMIQEVSTLPEYIKEESYAADIHINPDGRHLYASNRGHNSLVQFSVKKDGKLEQVSHFSTLGSWPRNFAIHPKDPYLVVANQKSNDLQLYLIEENGALKHQNFKIEIPQASCLSFSIP